MILEQGPSYNDFYKIIVVGDASVGKTHLIQRYVKGYAPKNPMPTIGVQFATKTVTISNGQKAKAQIWDTTGQQKYRSLTISHYRKANGAIIVYDITKEKSFQSVRSWLQNIRQYAQPNCRIMLVGNKCDLPGRVVSRAQGQQLAHAQNLLFEQTSAVSGNVNTIFERLCQHIATKKEQPKELPPPPRQCNC